MSSGLGDSGGDNKRWSLLHTLWTHFKTGHVEVAAELEVGSGMGKRKKTKDNVRVPRELQAETAAISWDNTAGRASLSQGRRRWGGGGGRGDLGSSFGGSSFSWLSDILGNILFSNY